MTVVTIAARAAVAVFLAGLVVGPSSSSETAGSLERRR
jgi:hypothetical protein